MSSTTMSLFAARKFTASSKVRLKPSKLAKRSWAIGAMSWTISSRATPSAPVVPTPKPASRSSSPRNDCAMIPPEVETSVPPTRFEKVAGRSPAAIASSSPLMPSEITPMVRPLPSTPASVRRSLRCWSASPSVSFEPTSTTASSGRRTCFTAGSAAIASSAESGTRTCEMPRFGASACTMPPTAASAARGETPGVAQST